MKDQNASKLWLIRQTPLVLYLELDDTQNNPLDKCYHPHGMYE